MKSKDMTFVFKRPIFLFESMKSKNAVYSGVKVFYFVIDNGVKIEWSEILMTWNAVNCCKGLDKVGYSSYKLKKMP